MNKTFLLLAATAITTVLALPAQAQNAVGFVEGNVILENDARMDSEASVMIGSIATENSYEKEASAYVNGDVTTRNTGDFSKVDVKLGSIEGNPDSASAMADISGEVLTINEGDNATVITEVGSLTLEGRVPDAQAEARVDGNVIHYNRSENAKSRLSVGSIREEE